MRERVTNVLILLALAIVLPSCAIGGGPGVDFQRVAQYQQEARALRDQATTIRALIAQDTVAGKSKETIALEIGLAVQQVVLETILMPVTSQPARE